MTTVEVEVEAEVEAIVETKANLKDEVSFTKKRNRKHSAQTLPLGLEHHMMKKYVVYYREWIDRSHTKEREYFKIEKHPDLPKSWTSSKSGKVKLVDKLADANKIVDDLEKKRKEELDKENQNPNPPTPL
jgi:hypothetical protein